MILQIALGIVLGCMTLAMLRSVWGWIFLFILIVIFLA